MWRRALVGFEEKAGVCRSCSYPDAAWKMSQKEIDYQENLIAMIGEALAA